MWESGEEGLAHILLLLSLSGYTERADTADKLFCCIRYVP